MMRTGTTSGWPPWPGTSMSVPPSESRPFARSTEVIIFSLQIVEFMGVIILRNAVFYAWTSTKFFIV